MHVLSPLVTCMVFSLNVWYSLYPVYPFSQLSQVHYLEGRISIKVKHAKVDIVAGQRLRQYSQAEPDSLVLFCVWV